MCVDDDDNFMCDDHHHPGVVFPHNKKGQRLPTNESQVLPTS